VHSWCLFCMSRSTCFGCQAQESVIYVTAYHEHATVRVPIMSCPLTPIGASVPQAQPVLANAPPAGPHEPLRLRGDSSGNLLQPEDEAATIDEEVLACYSCLVFAFISQQAVVAAAVAGSNLRPSCRAGSDQPRFTVAGRRWQ
jgi:hypothetical protein